MQIVTLPNGSHGMRLERDEATTAIPVVNLRKGFTLVACVKIATSRDSASGNVCRISRPNASVESGLRLCLDDAGALVLTMKGASQSATIDAAYAEFYRNRWMLICASAKLKDGHLHLEIDIPGLVNATARGSYAGRQEVGTRFQWGGNDLEVLLGESGCHNELIAPRKLAELFQNMADHFGIDIRPRVKN